MTSPFNTAIPDKAMNPTAADIENALWRLAFHRLGQQALDGFEQVINQLLGFHPIAPTHAFPQR